MKYYIVSDVHGHRTYLINSLREAGFFEDAKPHKLILCGDLLDRGPEARELVDFMIELMEKGELIYVLGNHEELMVQCLHEIVRGGVFGIACGMSHHYTNKTWDTLLQLSEMSEKEACEQPNELVRRIRQSPFYKRLLPICVDYYETANYIFTHGWIPCKQEGYITSPKYKYDPNWRCADEEAWHKARWYNGMDLACKHHVIERGKTIVCGHWNASYGHALIDWKGSEFGNGADHSPYYAEGIIAIDACTVVTKQVNCIVIEDE